jgi:hypothetical protein
MPNGAGIGPNITVIDTINPERSARNSIAVAARKVKKTGAGESRFDERLGVRSESERSPAPKDDGTLKGIAAGPGGPNHRPVNALNRADFFRLLRQGSIGGKLPWGVQQAEFDLLLLRAD